jgi:ComF family protein
VIHAFKYDGRQSLAAGLGREMRRRGLVLLEDADCVVPVPLHRRRERARGFNQARELARHLGVPVVDALVRTRPTVPQAALAAGNRYDNMRGAFALRVNFKEPVSVSGLRVVLVDDVSTTGSTLGACGAVLREAGALEVCALTAARVVTRLR